MLPKKFRLKVQDFYNNPFPNTNLKGGLIFLSLKQNKTNLTRFGIIVPKKLDKRAVFRRRTKRIIIEEIRPLLTRVIVSCDVLIKARKIINKEEKVKIRQEVLDLLQKAKLIRT